MADPHSAQEKTERATPKRIEDARKRGQVVRSPELNAAAVTLAGGAALWLAGANIARRLTEMMRDALAINQIELLNPSVAMSQFVASMLQSALACAPVLGLTFIAAVVAPMALSGWNFSGAALGVKFERLDPIAGFGRMFSLRGFVEIGKAFAKFMLVAYVAWTVLRNQQAEILQLNSQPTVVALAHAAALCGSALLALGAALAFIAILDVPWQIWQYNKELRMSREEIREESKESDGSPEIKSRIRAVQQAMARRRMMAEVPRATVVITNPTHYAVALRYDDKRSRAPILVAKGAEAVAVRIREIAAEHGVPLVEAPPLARALYRGVEIGVEIPAALYVSVAQVLTYVFQLRTARSTGQTLPPTPDIDPAVEELIPRRGS